MFVFEDGVPNDGLTQGIGRNEVIETLSRLKKGVTTEMDGIPEDVWMCGCVWEKKILACYQSDAKRLEQENISMEWIESSLIVPIYKEE